MCKTRILILRLVKKNQETNTIITKAMLGVLELVRLWKEEGMIIEALNGKNIYIDNKDKVSKWSVFQELLA